MDIATVQDVLEMALQVVGILSILASGAPIPRKTSGIIAIMRRIIDLGAFNFGSAKNEK